jgi:hypothetical protein
MTKYFLFFALNLLLLNSNIAQSYAIQRGHSSDDLYIYCRKNPASNSIMQFYRLWEHGQRISVQYTIPYPAEDNDLNLKNFTADPTPGMLFCTSLGNADTSIYKSTDYGKNWQRMTTLFNGLTPPIALLGGSVAGEIILTERPSASYFSIGSTTDYFATHVTNAQYTSYFTKPEVGINSGEIYGINNAYASNRDFLLFSPDFGVTIDTLAIDSAIVYNANGNLAHKVCHGTLPGEIFLITLEPEQSGFPHVYKIYHSTDYGSTYSYKSEIKFDESSSYTDFTGGREDCAFYVVNWKFNQQLQRQFMQVYYSTDCGQTFTMHEHDLDAFVSIAETEVKIDAAFVVFPNPSDNKLAIQSNTELKNSLFTLYDMQGKVILEQSITNAVQQLDVSMLPAGTYPWQIVYKNKVIESGKWVKK